MRRQAQPEMTMIGVRVPDPLLAKLNAIAEAEDRPLSYVVRRILAAHVEETAEAKS